MMSKDVAGSGLLARVEQFIGVELLEVEQIYFDELQSRHPYVSDVFARRPDGRLVFMDRVKYMIKSGGENIYPAEIERVLLSDPRVDDAVVVRRADPRWGEVPVAAVATSAPVEEAELSARCREALAGYKQPRAIRFVAFADLPRSTTGKIQRHLVEKWFEDG